MNELEIQNKIMRVFCVVSDDKMYADVLDIVLEVTKSPHGIFGYVDNEENFICPSITRDVWEQCQISDKTIIFPRDKWGGIWGRALVERKTLWSNKLFTVPKGHIAIRRMIVVPIIHQNQLIGLFEIGNKKKDYDDADVQMIEKIALQVGPILSARLERDRYEDMLKKDNEALMRQLEIKIDRFGKEVKKFGQITEGQNGKSGE